MKRYIFLFFILASALLCQSQVDKSKKAVRENEIIILHVNDIHGNIDNFPRLAFLVDSMRNLYQNVFLLNAGDIFTGNPYVDMYQDKGFPVIDLMNDVGFDLSALGNHEFDYGQNVLALRIKQAKFPFICANFENAGDILTKPMESIQLKTKNGIKINVFSLLDNSANGLPESHPSKLKGLKFQNGLKIASKYKKLDKTANVFIALTHLGLDADIELAKQMPELDLIVGGHTHTKIDSGKIENNVLITQAGARLKFLGQVNLLLQDGKVTQRKSKLIPIDKYGNVDLKIKEKVEKYNINPYFDEVIGQASEDLIGLEELGAYETDAYRDFGNFDIAFQNSGGIRISEIEKGNITRGLIYQLDPFGNYLIKIEMSLDEIKSLITKSFKNNEIDIRVSGIHYNIITENGTIKDVHITDYMGNELSTDKIYKVAMNDYILNTYNFDHANKGEVLNYTTSEILTKFLEKGPINYSGVKRTFINGK